MINLLVLVKKFDIVQVRSGRNLDVKVWGFFDFLLSSGYRETGVPDCRFKIEAVDLLRSKGKEEIRNILATLREEPVRIELKVDGGRVLEEHSRRSVFKDRSQHGRLGSSLGQISLQDKKLTVDGVCLRMRISIVRGTSLFLGNFKDLVAVAGTSLSVLVSLISDLQEDFIKV